jgi:hypothetical protein
MCKDSLKYQNVLQEILKSWTRVDALGDMLTSW